MKKTFLLIATLCMAFASCSSKEDKWLDAYEEYANETIAVAERIKNGDTAGTEDFKELLEKGQELKDEFLDTQKNFNQEQLDRFNQITDKVTKETLSAVTKSNL